MSFLFEFVKSIKGYFVSSDEVFDRDVHANRFYAGANTELQVHIQRNDVKGIVTFINELSQSGRIDGYINFDGNTKVSYECDGNKIVVGAEVLVDLVRNTKISPWYVTNMRVLFCPKPVHIDSEWEEEEVDVKLGQRIVEKTDHLPQKQVGMITESYNGNLVLNNDIRFRQRDCGANSFQPKKGDWVVVQFDHISKDYKVVAIHPLRYVDFEGCISAVKGRTGYVEREIWYDLSVTAENHLRRGEPVYGTAIESVQGKTCNFRALTLFRKSDDLKNNSLLMRVKSVDSYMENVINPKLIGIEVSETRLDFGEQVLNDVKVKEIIFKNKSNESLIIEKLSLNSETNDQFLIADDIETKEMIKDEPVIVKIRCKPQFPGLDTQKLIMDGKDSNEKLWKIVLDISVYAVDPAANEYSRSSANSEVPLKPVAIPASNVVSGIYLPAAKPLKISSVMTKMYPHKLKSYPIPEDLEKKMTMKENISESYPTLTEPLNPGSYLHKMNLLVHLEEINTKEEMKQFIMEDIRMMSRRETFGIEVPGLTEGRPSLLVGDRVNVTLNCPGNPSYSGNIEEILSNCIFVKFHPSLHSNYTNELCRISFEHSRLPFRRMHLGIDMACGNLGDSILFPKNIEKKSSQCVRLSRKGQNELSAGSFVLEDVSNLLHLKFYNSNLNELQRVAVTRILHGYSRPLPYVLFGPPGTGKTVTLVEAALQIYKNVPSSRILLCAPSNSAADLLCLRLDQSRIIETGEMVRMNAYRRTILSEISDKEPIPPKILPYCKSMDELSEVAMHRIIITTCVSSGSLYQLGLKSGHISHVFVDEAGQASEPEIMICMGFISPFSGQIVLAGDPMQLGPVIRSKIAAPLEESYLHRLLQTCPLYGRQKEACAGSGNLFNPLVVTQLLMNYRAHPTLLKLPSDLFYDGSLIACCGQEHSNFMDWKWLPNPKVPLIFQGVRGKEVRNARNPSTYNPSEAVMVVRWIGRLLQDANQFDKKFDYSKISIITPYRAQVDCIRKMVRSCLDEQVNLAKLKVGSVEEFQGQENEVVIISTVRSSLDGGDDRQQRACGGDNGGPHESMSIISTLSSRLRFLSNKRRFNVSITRACSLMIVVGDPGLLQYDSCWDSLVTYARDNGAYCGSN